MTKGAQAYNGVKIVSSINGVGRTGLICAKKEKRKKVTGAPIYTIHQKKLKMDKRLKCDSRYHKSPSRENKLDSDISWSNIFGDISKTREIKKMELYQIL